MRNFSQFKRDSSGSAAVEFALIGPAFIGMFMGVLQLGMGMQNYNALRSISADVSRYAVVNYQTSNRLNIAQLQSYANGIASAPPYGLVRNRFGATVSVAANQRVTGANEYSIQVTYRVPTFLAIFGISDIPLTYTRPIFVVTATP